MENTPPDEWPRVKSILVGALLFVVTTLVVLRLLDYVLLPLLVLEMVSEGVYFYMIRGESVNLQPFLKHGHISVLH